MQWRFEVVYFTSQWLIDFLRVRMFRNVYPRPMLVLAKVEKSRSVTRQCSSVYLLFTKISISYSISAIVLFESVRNSFHTTLCEVFPSSASYAISIRKLMSIATLAIALQCIFCCFRIIIIWCTYIFEHDFTNYYSTGIWHLDTSVYISRSYLNENLFFYHQIRI